MEQMSLAAVVFVKKDRKTRQQTFLEEMERVVPWKELMAVIAPHYDKTGARGGRPPTPLSIMLRIHFLQQWFNLSDPGMEEKLYEVPMLCAFAGIDRGMMNVPDETTILNFRHLLEAHSLAETMFARVNGLLREKGLLLRQGTLVDATLIAAPPSTKNATGQRDPAMHQAKKGQQWHFGMKAHIGADMESGLVHTVVGTAANVHDVTQAHVLLHGEEELAGGDAGYTGVEKRPEAKTAIPWLVAMRPGTRRALRSDVRSDHALLDDWERIKARVRAKVEHPFRVVKRQFGYGICQDSCRVISKKSVGATYEYANCTISSSFYMLVCLCG
jgi:IS5 family transposase